MSMPAHLISIPVICVFAFFILSDAYQINKLNKFPEICFLSVAFFFAFVSIGIKALISNKLVELKFLDNSCRDVDNKQPTPTIPQENPLTKNETPD
jgi:hypothetical protein